MTEFDELPVEPIAGRTGFVAKMQPAVPLLQFAHKTAHTLGISPDLADVSNLALSAFLGNRHGVAGLGHIQSYENLCMLLHGSSSCAEDRPAPCGQPSVTRAV